MKRIVSTIVMALVLAIGASAQSQIELARQQQELDKVLRKSLEMKPTKEAKKLAKDMTKQGWMVPAGERSIEQQLTRSQILGEDMTTDENGFPIKRFIMQTSNATAGTYNAAYAAARSNAQTEIATMLETEVAAAMAGKLDNAQHNAVNATTVDKFNERVKAIVHQSLTNSIPVLAVYRVLPNYNYEVQVRIAYNRNEVTSRLKKNMQRELEIEGDELNDLIDSLFENID